MIRVLTPFLLALSTGFDVAGAAEPPPTASHVFRHREKVEALFAENRAAFGDDADRMVRRGLIANRKTGEVELHAEATGLSANTAIEFILISENSGHDYEALAITYARPSDIHTALEFIGIPAGAPYNPRAFRYAPKGERVQIRLGWDEDGGTSLSWHAEELIMDSRTGNALPLEGFVFVGSQWLTEDGERTYAADAYDPKSIASTYNEPTTVLDVPRAEGQSAVYGFLLPFDARQAAAGTFLSVRLVPEPNRTAPRVADITLTVRAGHPDEEPVLLSLRHADGTGPDAGNTLAEVFRALNRLKEADRTPYLTLALGPHVPLRELRDLMRVLDAFQQEATLHIEPPLPGDLFFRAFIPPETHRDRAARPSQALELRLSESASGLSAVVNEITDTRARREDPFTADIRSHTVSSPDALPDLLAQIGHRLPVLLVFAPTALTYGQVMTWVRPVLETHPTIYVFLEESESE